MKHMMIQDRRLGWTAALAAAVLWGVLVVFTMPHGPATARQALVVMFLGLGVGGFAGLAAPSRWALLAAPAAHLVSMELLWLNVPGPTVDGLRFDNIFGILAFILGRGLYFMVGVMPMLLGMVAARTWTTAKSGKGAKWNWAILFAMGFIIVAVLIAIPASTPPILGADGKELPGSIAELSMVEIGGCKQGVLIRGHDIENPVLLYLSGGPGQSSLPHPRVIFSDLEQDFTIVSWDQRGTGKSYAALDPTSALTLEQAVADTVELTNYLRNRFDEEKIYILGESWGTTLGVLAIQKNPELYHAFIGSGQMVSQRETDRRLYADVLELAAQQGNNALAEQMHTYGEPPYADIPYAYAFVMGYYDALYQPYTPPQSYLLKGSGANLGPWGVMGSEYNLIEKANVLRGLIDMFTLMYPQIQQVDFRRDAARLEVPVYILDGAAELTARRDLALEWYALLEAPIKRIFTFENAGHAVAFEQYAEFHRILLETVLPETYPVK